MDVEAVVEKLPKEPELLFFLVCISCHVVLLTLVVFFSCCLSFVALFVLLFSHWCYCLLHIDVVHYALVFMFFHVGATTFLCWCSCSSRIDIVMLVM